MSSTVHDMFTRTLSLKMAAGLDAGIRAVINEKLGRDDWSFVDVTEYCSIKIHPDVFGDNAMTRHYDIYWLDGFIGQVQVATHTDYEKLSATVTVKASSEDYQPLAIQS